MSQHYSSGSATNSLAIVSLVSGIVSWFAIPLLGAIVAIITGHMARSQIKQSYESGDGLAIVGLILGYLNLAVSCLLPILIFGGIISAGGICSICAALTESGGFDVSAVNMPPLPLN